MKRCLLKVAMDIEAATDHNNGIYNLKIMLKSHNQLKLYIKTLLVFGGLMVCFNLPAQEIKYDHGVTQDNRDLYFDAAKEKVLGNLDKALDLFSEYLKSHPEDAATMYEMADIYSQLKQPGKALPLAEKAVKLDESNKWYKILLFQLYQTDSNFDDAGKVIDQLLNQLRHSFFVDCTYWHDVLAKYI